MRKAVNEPQNFAVSGLKSTTRAKVKMHTRGPCPSDSDPGICVLTKPLSW